MVPTVKRYTSHQGTRGPWKSNSIPKENVAVTKKNKNIEHHIKKMEDSSFCRFPKRTHVAVYVSYSATLLASRTSLVIQPHPQGRRGTRRAFKANQTLNEPTL